LLRSFFDKFGIVLDVFIPTKGKVRTFEMMLYDALYYNTNFISMVKVRIYVDANFSSARCDCLYASMYLCMFVQYSHSCVHSNAGVTLLSDKLLENLDLLHKFLFA
jgi:hypothetical protein